MLNIRIIVQDFITSAAVKPTFGFLPQALSLAHLKRQTLTVFFKLPGDFFRGKFLHIPHHILKTDTLGVWGMQSPHSFVPRRLPDEPGRRVTNPVRA